MSNSIIIILYIILSHTTYSQVNSYLDSHAGGRRASVVMPHMNKALRVSWIVPNESGWSGYRHNNYGTVLIKNKDSLQNNQEIEVYIVENRHLFFYHHDSNLLHKEVTSNIKNYYENIKEYSLNFIEVERYAGNKNCLKIHILLEDMQEGSDKQKRWNEQYALSCRFPFHRHIGFEFRYYQRYYDDNKDYQFSNKAHELFKSIKIEDRIVDGSIELMKFFLITLGVIPVQFYTVKPPLKYYDN